MKIVPGQAGAFPLNDDELELKVEDHAPYVKTQTLVVARLQEPCEVETDHGTFEAREGDYLAQHLDGAVCVLSPEALRAGYLRIAT